MKNSHSFCIVIMFLTAELWGMSLQSESFSVIEWAAGPLFEIGHRELGQYWRYAGGLGLNARTPFYFGTAELGVELRSYEEFQAVEFQQMYCYLAFLTELALSRNISGSCGVSVGNTLFRFGSEENERLRYESELTLGLKAGLTVLLKRNLVVRLGFSHEKIFTHHPIVMTSYGLMLGFRMNTPHWLRNFLK